MKNWEYKLLSGYETKELIEKMNKLGKEGWRVSKMNTVAPTLSPGHVVICMERRLP